MGCIRCYQELYGLLSWAVLNSIMGCMEFYQVLYRVLSWIVWTAIIAYIEFYHGLRRVLPCVVEFSHGWVVKNAFLGCMDFSMGCKEFYHRLYRVLLWFVWNATWVVGSSIMSCIKCYHGSWVV